MPASCPPLFQVHVYDPYDDDYYQAVPIDSHQTAYISSGHYGHQYGGGWPRLPSHPQILGFGAPELGWEERDSPIIASHLGDLRPVWGFGGG